MDACGSIGGVNSHKGDTDDYKHEVTYNNTLHKVSSEMLLGLIYGLVNPHTLIVIIISCTSFLNLFMFRYDTQTHTRNGAQRTAWLFSNVARVLLAGQTSQSATPPHSTNFTCHTLTKLAHVPCNQTTHNMCTHITTTTNKTQNHRRVNVSVQQGHVRLQA